MSQIEISALLYIDYAHTDLDVLVDAYGKELDRTGRKWEMIFIMDGVEGVALPRLKEIQKQGKPVIGISLRSSHGESVAYAAGAEKARGKYLLTLPAYLQIDPKEIHTLVQELDAGASLVTPWRNPRVDPWVNRLQSSIFNLVIRRIISTRFHDLNCSFRGIRREVLEEITLYGDLFRFLPVTAERNGFKVREVSVCHLQELGKKGYFGLGVYVRRLLDILTIVFLARFTQKPLRFFGVLGVVLMVVGAVLAADPLISKIFGGSGVQERPLFLVGVTIFTFGVQLIGFGLVGEIIIYTQARHLREYKADQVLTARDPQAEIPGPEPVAPTTKSGSRKPELLIRGLAPGEDSRWDRYVRNHAGGTPFHLSGWRRVVWETFGHEPQYLVAELNDQILGVLPVFRARCFSSGLQRVKVHLSIPYAVYGGVLADNEEVEQALLKEACRAADVAEVEYLEIRERRPRDYGFKTNDIYASFIKDLPADPEACLEMIPRKARAEVRKGINRHQLSFAETMDISTFHQLFAMNKRDLGTPSLPRRFFAALEEEFGNSVLVHSVKTSTGESVAAVLSFVWHDTIMPYYSGAVKEKESLGINNFMYWGLMRWAAEREFKTFDFGRSRVDSGSYQFKKNMGFTPEEMHYQYYMVNSDSLPSFHPGNPQTGRARRVWSKLPLFLSTCLGGRLSRYLP